MKKAVIMAALASTSLLGCGGGEYLRTQADAHRQAVAAVQAFSKQEAKPRLSIEFHEDGRVRSIEMYDARPLPRVPEFNPTPHPGWGVVSTAAAAILPSVGSSLTLWAAGQAFEGVARHISGDSSVTTTRNTMSTDARDMSVRTQDNDPVSTVVRGSNIGGRDAGDSTTETNETSVTANSNNERKTSFTTDSNNETTETTETTTESFDLDYNFRPNQALFTEE